MAAKSHKAIHTFLFENLSHQKGILHFISTRNGGVSKPPFDTLNLSFNVSDDPKHVILNRKLLADAVGFKVESLTAAKQVHGSKVAIVPKNMRGKGAMDHISALDEVDAMVTNTPGILLMIQAADCVPLLFYDPKQKVIAAAHAGWRGTTLNMAHNTVSTMVKRYKSDPRHIYVGIGPSIGPCCYEVGHEVVREAANNLKDASGLIKARDGKNYFDMWEANKRQLTALGIPESNIEVSKICTHCESDTFFSSRAGAGVTGRFGAGIMLA
ncbi:MAG: peptidoglycan editing factor PgeF [bacterium]